MPIDIILRVSDLESRLKALQDLFDAKPPAHALNSEELKQCCEVWRTTLEAFKIPRPVLSHEMHKVAQLVKQYGSTAVMYALYGARFEEGTSSFNPSKNVSLSRLFDEKMFEKSLNLGAQARELERKKREQK